MSGTVQKQAEAKMTWDCYELVFRLKSPLHIGGRMTGNLQETRPYVTGKMLWAALTARLTRHQNQGQNGVAYQTFGDILRTNLRFGYLWPSIHPPVPYYPWKEPAAFDYSLLNSYMSTAKDDNLRAALDGSLHETEYISPYARNGEPVYLVGWLWAKQDFPKNGWQTALHQIQLGGERAYGWGCIELVGELKPAGEPRIPDPDNFSWQGYVPAHLRAVPTSPTGINGNIEPIVGWETHLHGGKRLNPATTVAYQPGSWIENPVQLRVGEYGIWETLQ